jgi:WD40 repeat protein
MTKVFISYSRKDKVFAGKFTEALQKSELETWIDWEDIPPTADWLDQIHKGIEQADAFLFLLSPDSVASKVCGQEVDHAVQNGKRLIPIVARDVNPNDVHPALGKVNWIYCRESDDFDGAVNKTLSAIRTDLVWVESHRRLQVRALEWEKRKDNSLLLRGKDLREAEEQFASAGQKDPQPTDLQRQYVLSSRNGETRTRNMILAIAAVVMVALAVAAVIAVNQSNYATEQASTAVAESNMRGTAEANAVSEANTRATAQANAEEQARVALSRQLAAQSDAVREEDLTLSLLLSLEALKTKRTSEAQSALLQGLQVSPEAFVLEGTGTSIVSLAFNPDKRVMASGDENGTIFLWDISDMSTPILLGKPLKVHTESVNSLAFSPDGLILASGSADDTLRLWDVSNPAAPTQLGSPLKEHSGNVTYVSYCGKSKILVSTSVDSTVIFWDTSSPSAPIMIGSFNLGYADGLSSIAINPTGNTLAAAGKSAYTTDLWDISNPAAPIPYREPLQGETGYVTSLAFSPDGLILASGSVDNIILFFDISTPDSPNWVGEILDEDNLSVPSIAFAPDGETLASGRSDGSIRLWDVSNPYAPQKIGKSLSGHSKHVNSLLFDPSTWMLASAGQDTNTILWDIFSPYAPIRPRTALLGQAYGVEYLVFSTDGNKLAALGNFDSPVILWDVSNPSSPLRLGALPAERIQNVQSAAFAQNGNVIILVHNDFSNTFLTAWDISVPKTPRQMGTVWYFDVPVKSVAFNPGKNLMASVMNQMDENGKYLSEITLWDVSTPASPKQLGTILKGYPGDVYDVVFGLSQDLLVFDLRSLDTSSDESILFWNISDPVHPAQVGTLEQEQTGGATNIAVSPPGDILASWGSLGKSIYLWDISDPADIAQLGYPLEGNGTGKGFAVGPYSVAISQDGNLLASGGTDGTLLLWDISNPGEPRRLGMSLEQYADVINKIVFNPNGLMASSSYDGSLMLWDMNLDSWINIACSVAHRNFTRIEWERYGLAESYRATCTQWSLESEITATPTP